MKNNVNFKENYYQKYVSNHTDTVKKYSGDINLKAYNKSYEQHFGAHLPESKNSIIVDLGCGYGNFVNWLNSIGYSNTVGVDLSREQIDKGISLGIANLICTDVFEYLSAVDVGSLDCIVAKDILEHFTPEQVILFLELAKRALKEEGLIILQVPNGASPYFGRIRYGDFTHELAFTASSIKQVLKNASFESIQVLPWPPVRSSLNSHLRYFLWRFVMAIVAIPVILETGKWNHILTMNLIVTCKKNSAE